VCKEKSIGGQFSDVLVLFKSVVDKDHIVAEAVHVVAVMSRMILVVMCPMWKLLTLKQLCI
jgi:hypothetical protein